MPPVGLPRNALVRMVGRVGYDMFADHLKASLAAAGVDVSGVIRSAKRTHRSSVDRCRCRRSEFDYRRFRRERAFLASDIEGSRSSFRNSRYALFQLETPLDTVAAALRLARREGAKTILDPAPAQHSVPSLDRG